MKKRRKRHPLVQVVIPTRSLAQVAPTGSQSEVSLLMKRFRDEEEAAQRGLYGFAQTAQHEMITARMERWGMLQEQLTELVGENTANRMIVEAMGADEKPEEGEDT
ncbi:MAG TPA: hypothetical protein VHV10_10885 [Ktedonobacteraceae bacterium]|nr:hypothetical protein [Ktedonobacteraceae bacterium]